jgi:hypothetical protein
MVSLVLGIYGLGRFTFERLHRYELILKVIMKHTSFDIGIDSNKFLYLLMKLHIISLLNLGMQSLRPYVINETCRGQAYITMLAILE